MKGVFLNISPARKKIRTRIGVRGKSYAFFALAQGGANTKKEVYLLADLHILEYDK